MYRDAEKDDRPHARAGSTRVLHLTHHLPYPPVSGGRRRQYELIRRLPPDVRVHVVAVSKTYEEDAEALDGLADHCERIDLIAAAPARQNGECLQIARHHSAEARCHIASLIESGVYDAIHVEGFYLVQHLPARLPAPLVLVEHNIEWDLWRQRAALAATAETAAIMRAEVERTRRDELAAWRRADVLVAVSEDDRREMARLTGREVILVPDGVDFLPDRGLAEGSNPDLSRAAPLLVMAANFGYEPNVDGAEWLCREVMPRIWDERPDTRLVLAGNAPRGSLDEAAIHPEVVITGRVPRITPYLDIADVVLCPLRVGGGMKVKVLEGLGRGKAVVTTSIGAQGLGADARSALRVHDDPPAFAGAVTDLVNDPRERERLERRARKAAMRLPSWDEAAARLESVYRSAARVPAAAQT
jgi:glycosyltransferase involved in cell wall biosynthesis